MVKSISSRAKKKFQSLLPNRSLSIYISEFTASHSTNHHCKLFISKSSLLKMKIILFEPHIRR